MKVHLTYREINFLLEKVTDELKNIYMLQHKYKSETGRIPRNLLVEADTSEDCLEKLTVGKLKCELKHEKMVEHAKGKEKKKIH